ncbi:MAG: hypothetical protein ACRC1D_07585 [Culicoidibacterales bacterium]
MYANYNNAGTSTNAKTAMVRGARGKQIGIKSGVADIFLPLARQGCNGLFIEMKIDLTNSQNDGSDGKKKYAKASSDQIAFRDQVREDNFGWVCCHGWRDAVKVLERYLS